MGPTYRDAATSFFDIVQLIRLLGDASAALFPHVYHIDIVMNKAKEIPEFLNRAVVSVVSKITAV